jgi:hypothetical protein
MDYTVGMLGESVNPADQEDCTSVQRVFDIPKPNVYSPDSVPTRSTETMAKKIPTVE